MASTASNGILPPEFLLTPQQQSLLLAALNANKEVSPPANNTLSLSPSEINDSPQQQGDASGFQDSPFIDNYDYDFGPDSSFDFSFDNGAKMIGDLPGTTGSDSPENEHEKRAHPDDEDDESPEASGGNGAKRRESSEKVPKKPGRKPLTSEPTSKRKAQNRAAQRAFRERKEKHVKDLETKVTELEKASEAVNNENSALRTQIEQITAELSEYKRKVQVMAKDRPQTKSSYGFGNAAVNSLSDVNFQFEFPKFGVLPGPKAPKPVSASFSPPNSTINSNGVSPQQKTRSLTNGSTAGGSPLDALSHNDFSSLPQSFPSPFSMNAHTSASRTSLDSGHFSLGATATSSPSASSNSNMGASSSCGTSPEPFTQSPLGFKPVDTMTTIGEENSSLGADQTQNQFDGVDVNTSFDWLIQQNGGQFDPQLFGDYRESQDSILSGTLFDDSFFNDALDSDFATPYNTAPTLGLPKKSLVAEIDAKQDEDATPAKTQPMNCNKIWEKLQNCDKVQNGEFDLDSLCSELTKKAKCSGQGPVIQEQEFDTILKKYLGKDLAESAL